MPKIEGKAPKNESEDKTENPQNEDESSWGRDQREKSYYYDDSHGYEIYEPAEDEKDENE